MRLKRIEAGHYVSYDGRVVIQKHVVGSSKVYRVNAAPEVSWSVHIDGRYIGIDQETKRDAVALAERKLNKEHE